jgi:hypothetical protein
MNVLALAINLQKEDMRQAVPLFELPTSNFELSLSSRIRNPSRCR